MNKKLILSILMALIVTSMYGRTRDWAKTDRYADRNEEIAASGKYPEIVFFGDSITDQWVKKHGEFFTQHGFVGRGIGGQTTCETLIRMRPDVIDLHPKKVVILIGVNDIAQNIGPVDLEVSMGNIISMCELAKANRIKPILCSILPAYNFRWRPELEPAGDVKRFNAMIEEYAKKNRIPYVDYYSSLVDEKGGIDPKYSEETVHPNLEGYYIMESIIMKYLK